jgi:hypothetical protein
MTVRKYITEFALNMHMTHDMLLQQDDLSKVGESNYFNEDNPCHIYLICRRPRIILKPEDFKVENKKILFPFQVQRQDKFEQIYIEAPYKDDPTGLELISEYPFNFFEFRKGDKILQIGKTALLFQSFRQNDYSLLDLEVLYIGQSYGVEGARTAPDRLQSHSIHLGSDQVKLLVCEK